MVAPPAGHALDFDAMYERWFPEAVRWLRALGGPASDVDDMAQEMFIVVLRKLEAFDGQNLAGWLYRIAERTASDFRRRAWFRRVFGASRTELREDMIQTTDTPAELFERRELQQTVNRLLERMSSRLRATFVLFEIEGYTIEEIARLQTLPPATVRTRLHYARKRFVELVRKYELQEQT
jgi:RNA polymerase sigma-70 factor, ECF subfamily